MTGNRLRLDRATVIDPVANTLPEVKAKQPALARCASPLVDPRRYPTANHLAPGTGILNQAVCSVPARGLESTT